MFKTKRKLMELDRRLEAIEAELVFRAKFNMPAPESKCAPLSYEEVVNLWLNGQNK